MPIFDTHVHYNLEPLYSNWQQYWSDAQAAGVSQSVVIGTSFETSQRAINIAQQEQGLYAAIGIHPHELQKAVLEQPAVSIDDWMKVLTRQLEQLFLDSQQKVVAIGEIGLDYYRLPSNTEVVNTISAAQQSALRTQLLLAKKLHLPVSLHVRDTNLSKDETSGSAYWQTLQILEEVFVNPESNRFVQPVVLHCVSGPMHYVKRAVSLGAYLGFAGNVTYLNAQTLRDILKITLADRILLETDAPYLAPQTQRGKVCEPAFIAETARFVASQVGVSTQTARDNARSVLGV